MFFCVTSPPQTVLANEPVHQSFNVGVKALILQNNRLLLLKRRDHHVWEMPGGRINANEEIEETLLRELSEELPDAGKFDMSDIVHAQVAEFTLPNHHKLMLLFFTVRPHRPLPNKPTLSSEHETTAWFTPEEFKRLKLQPQVYIAGMNAFKRLSVIA